MVDQRERVKKQEQESESDDSSYKEAESDDQSYVDEYMPTTGTKKTPTGKLRECRPRRTQPYRVKNPILEKSLSFGKWRKGEYPAWWLQHVDTSANIGEPAISSQCAFCIEDNSNKDIVPIPKRDRKFDLRDKFLQFVASDSTGTLAWLCHRRGMDLSDPRPRWRFCHDRDAGCIMVLYNRWSHSTAKEEFFAIDESPIEPIRTPATSNVLHCMTTIAGTTRVETIPDLDFKYLETYSKVHPSHGIPLASDLIRLRGPREANKALLEKLPWVHTVLENAAQIKYRHVPAEVLSYLSPHDIETIRQSCFSDADLDVGALDRRTYRQPGQSGVLEDTLNMVLANSDYTPSSSQLLTESPDVIVEDLVCPRSRKSIK